MVKEADLLSFNSQFLHKIKKFFSKFEFSEEYLYLLFFYLYIYNR